MLPATIRRAWGGHAGLRTLARPLLASIFVMQGLDNLRRPERVAPVALAATLVPTTLAAHRFWEADDAEERMQKRIRFAKNLSIMGGLLLSAAD
jgi:uncharacterized membrane protein YphA (DoxX/SURF4 family)